ncbi:hypothetical protein [Kosakonia quasisacchari]|uniref:hypothetical protein n=1 Tax=Kosakonia quasisacchari TaxID=2529380 RepID=UPI0039DF9B90
MEWLVVEKALSLKNDQQMLKVMAEGKLTFIVWVTSNQNIEVGHMLTPVIDGYIANHDKGHFVTILKVKHFCSSDWLDLIAHPLSNIE